MQERMMEREKRRNSRREETEGDSYIMNVTKHMSFGRMK